LERDIFFEGGEWSGGGSGAGKFWMELENEFEFVIPPWTLAEAER